METVRIITHATLIPRARYPNCKQACRLPASYPELMAESVLKTKLWSLCWIVQLCSVSTMSIVQQCFSPCSQTSPPTLFVFCLIFGICGNVGNQTQVAAEGDNSTEEWRGNRSTEGELDWLWLATALTQIGCRRLWYLDNNSRMLDNYSL